MAVFSDLKILTKIALTMLVLIILSSISGLLNYHSLQTQQETTRMTEHTYQVIDSLNGVLRAMVDQETGVRAFLLSPEDRFLEPQMKGAKALRDNLDRLRNLTADNPKQQGNIDALESLSKAWMRVAVETEVPQMRDPATREKARNLEISGAGKEAMDGLRAKIEEMRGIETSLLKARAEEAVAAGNTARLVGIIGGAVVVLSALISLFTINISVVRPVRSIKDSMLRLAEGARDAVIPYAARKDEVGEMAAAVEVFRQAAIANHRLEQEAEAARRHAEVERQRVTAEAEAAAQARLEEATSGLASGLRRLARGDLSFELTEPFSAEFDALRHDLNSAVKQLAETLSTVAQTTASLDAGSQEISRGANDLSKRTEQQAASLEETAAALDQITAYVATSTKRVSEARGIALEANESATRSGTVVSEAVSAIERIEESSGQIANIIVVIDEIAFQTNLLALNAGVEAARAGEAGKGFAVVAQEVRELAQRSAKAAKEIKDLIRTSTDEVSTGVKLGARHRRCTAHDRNPHRGMNRHMEDIATSSKEQATALSEVNAAINQMDQVTQQNAAMVEETSASSIGLANDSARLRGLIEQFLLPASSASLHDTARMMREQTVIRQKAPVRTRSTQKLAAAPAIREEWSEF